MHRKMIDCVERGGKGKRVDFEEIVELLESERYCGFMEQRGLCDGKCVECKREVLDVIRGELNI